MIKGLYAGYNGLVYIYYKGPMSLVLSDVNAGFAKNIDKADTALRVVLKPFEWTVVAYEHIKNAWEGGTSQLNFLEKDGYIDIYTDPKEVEELKKHQVKNVTTRDNDRTYLKNLPKDPVVVDDQPKQPSAEVDGFKMGEQSPSKYFDPSSLERLRYAEKQINDVPKQDITQTPSVNPEMKTMMDFMMKQAESNAKQTEQLCKMVETTQNFVAMVLASMQKKQDIK